jgi:predicted transposase YbfD/YdcC
MDAWSGAAARWRRPRPDLAARRRGLRHVAAVEGTMVRDGKATTLTRYYITSRTMTAAQVLEAVRGHWAIENSVHWVLDVVFGDDYSRLRSAYGPRNMALVQRIALNLIRLRPSGKDSLTVKRKTPVGQ